MGPLIGQRESGYANFGPMGPDVDPKWVENDFGSFWARLGPCKGPFWALLDPFWILDGPGPSRLEGQGPGLWIGVGQMCPIGQITPGPWAQ